MRERLVFQATENGVSIVAEHHVIKRRYPYGNKARSEYRQSFYVNLNIDGFCSSGTSTCNPCDLVSEEKGIKLAIKDALSEEGHSVTTPSSKKLGHLDRSRVWKVFRKHYQFQKIAEGYKALTPFCNTYGDHAYYEMKKTYGLD